MSRSYKKHPVYSDHWEGKKFTKKWANRKIRHSKDIPNGKQYHKFYESWNIADYHCYWTKKDAKIWFRLHGHLWSKRYKDEDEYVKKVWFPCYKRK